MDSINQQQEDNIKSLNGPEAIAKLKELAEKAESCFFCSDIKTGLPFSTRPMSPQKIDDEGNIWFVSSKDSNKNQEVERDPFVQLLFQGGAHSSFLTVYGISEVIEDQPTIDELWEPLLKTWFQGGKDDPRISVIKVIPTQSYYWDTKHGSMIAFLKMATSAVIGKTMDDSVEGKLDVDAGMH